MHQNSGARYLPRPVSASRLFPGRRCSRRTLARMFFRSAASGNLQGRSSAFPPALQKARPPVDDRPHHHELRFDAADPAIGTPWPVATVIAVPRASSCHRLSIQCSDMNGSGVLSIVVRRTLASACGDSSLVFHRATFDVQETVEAGGRHCRLHHLLNIALADEWINPALRQAFVGLAHSFDHGGECRP
jgi:hypothetical protein